MPEVLVRVELGHLSGYAKDKVCNSFAIMAGDISGGWAGSVATEISDFYNAQPPGGEETLAGLLSPVLSRQANAAVMKFYDITDHLDGTPAGSPFYEIPFTLAALKNGAVQQPSQLSVCLTLEGQGRADQPVNVPLAPAGPTGDAHPRARRTGRLYLGPISQYGWQVVDDLPIVSDMIRASLLATANRLQDNLIAQNDGALWSVWSRVNATVYPIEAVSVTNRVATQRRRREAPTTRTRQVV